MLNVPKYFYIDFNIHIEKMAVDNVLLCLFKDGQSLQHKSTIFFIQVPFKFRLNKKEKIESGVKHQKNQNQI